MILFSNFNIWDTILMLMLQNTIIAILNQLATMQWNQSIDISLRMIQKVP